MRIFEYNFLRGFLSFINGILGRCGLKMEVFMDTLSESPARWIERRDGVRKRAGMYVGRVDDIGLHYLVDELLTNSVDSLPRDRAADIWVTIHHGREVTVADSGPGFPEATRVLMADHLGSRVQGPDRVRSAPRGIGLFCVHALSSSLSLETAFDGQSYSLHSKDGLLTGPILPGGPALSTGTSITFTPHASFNAYAFEFDRIITHCRQHAFLHPHVRFLLFDRRSGRRVSIHYPQGLAALVRDLLVPSDREASVFHVPLELHRRSESLAEISLAIATAPDDSSTGVRSFWNYTPSPEGGTHVEAFHDALRLLGLSMQNVTAALLVVSSQEQWRGCTKSAIDLPALKHSLTKLFAEHLARWQTSMADRRGEVDSWGNRRTCYSGDASALYLYR